MTTLPRSGILLATAAALAAGAAACGADPEGPAGAAADEAGDAGEAMGSALADQAGAELSGEPPEVVLGQVGAILIALDEGEIIHAEAELALGVEEGARRFAELLRDEHSVHEDQVADLLFFRRTSPMEGAVSSTLRAQATAGLTELEGAVDGADFTYLRLQVEMHAAGAILVEGLRQAAGGDAQLQELLHATHEAIVRHRVDAEALLRAR